MTGSGGDAPRLVPIHRRLVVGRECAGVDEAECLRIDDPMVSRWHFEIRIDPGGDDAVLVDTSTNGTRVNGMRVGPAAPYVLNPGDRITVGSMELEFRSDRVRTSPSPSRTTTRYRRTSTLVLVVGDIIGYSTITQLSDSEVVLNSIDALFGRIRELLTQHRGTLKDYIGDAVFAIWEPDHDPDAVGRAVAFALDACRELDALAPTLPARSPDGSPLRMGWAVVLGSAIESPLEGSQGGALVGDAVNLAFRLSGLAGRDGRAAVVVTQGVADAVGDVVRYTDPEDVVVKGRTGEERIYGVI